MAAAKCLQAKLFLYYGVFALAAGACEGGQLCEPMSEQSALLQIAAVQNVATNLKGEPSDVDIGEDDLQNQQPASDATGMMFKGVRFRTAPKSSALPCESTACKSAALHMKALEKIRAAGAHCKRPNWAVLTTINDPTPATEDLVRSGQWCIVVAADLKGPAKFQIGDAQAQASIVFLSAEFQQELEPLSDFIAQLPWQSFGRKNCGYLVAVANGAEMIWDYDDDNKIFVDAFLTRLDTMDVRVAPGPGAISDNVSVANIYDAFECSVWPCWPRGFPLSLVRSGVAPLEDWKHEDVRIGMLQSLADQDPDVDAVLRLTGQQASDIHFKRKIDWALALPPFVFCPANAQATLHYRDAFWAMLLPITVGGRVADIWRSYFAQRLFWDVGLHLAFAGPFVRQDRNGHEYLADLDAEKQLYSQTESLISFLWSWSSTSPTIVQRAQELWAAAYERGYVEAGDLKLLQLWLGALQSAGYEFPEPVTPNPSPHWKPQDVKHDKHSSLLHTKVRDDDGSSRQPAPEQGKGMGWKTEDVDVVFGVLSVPENRAARDATRSYFRHQADAKAKIYFLLDKQVELGSETLDDIIFLNSSYTGRANHFGEKLLLYFKAAINLHPTVQVIFKMDDDVIACMLSILQDVRGMSSDERTRLYYGFLHNYGCEKPNRSCRIDEAFVGVGRVLVDRIISRPYCANKQCEETSKSKPLIDTDYGGTSLGAWLEDYDDVFMRGENKHMVHKAEGHWPWAVFNEKLASQLCKTLVTFHKAHSVEQSMFAHQLAKGGPLVPDICFVQIPETGTETLMDLLGQDKDQRKKDLTACWSFAVVRNPWDRMVSWYSTCRSGYTKFVSSDSTIPSALSLRTLPYPKQACDLAQRIGFNEWLFEVLTNRSIGLLSGTWMFADSSQWLLDETGSQLVDYIAAFADEEFYDAISHHPSARRSAASFRDIQNPSKRQAVRYSNVSAALMRDHFAWEINRFQFPEIHDFGA